jgi:Xaa-Pro aminopeptidase
VDAAWSIGERAARLADLVGDVATLYARIPTGDAEFDALILRTLATGRGRRARRGTGAHTLRDPGLVLDGPRLRKDAHEIELMREAAALTAAVFDEAIRRIRPGAGEWEVEAALDGGFRARGALGPAFPTIVAGGANAATLHYTTNRDRLRDGDLVLLDAGARHAMYCADISRTLPVSGRFEAQQRDLYDVVLAAHDAAIAAVRPGALISAVHDAAVDVLLEGLSALGILTGGSAALRETPEAWRSLYPHQTSHWLGLDVHDAGAYLADGGATRLEAGMVLTIEPGLYFSSESGRVPPSPRTLGIRIEDDVLVTTTGHDVLTATLPVSPDALTARMR